RSVAHAEPWVELDHAGYTDVRGDIAGAVLIASLAEAGLEQDRQHPRRPATGHVGELGTHAPVIQVEIRVGSRDRGRCALKVAEERELVGELVRRPGAERDIRLQLHL